MADKSRFFGYLKKLFKDNFAFYLILCVISATVAVLMAASTVTEISESGIVHASFPAPRFIGYIGLYCGGASAIYSFARFKRRRNLDMLLSMPIGHKAVGAAHYIFGASSTALPIITAYSCNITAIVLNYGIEKIAVGWYILHFGVVLCYSILLYTLYVFVFNEANTLFDGCAFVFLWHNVFYFIMHARAKDSLNAHLLSPEKYLERVLFATERQICGSDGDFAAELFGRTRVVLATVGWIGLGILAGVLFAVRFGKRQHERAGEISTSIFGYNILIPLYAISGSLFGIYSYYDTLGDPMDITACLIFAFAAYWIFRRSVKFKIIDYCVLGFIVLLLITSCIKEISYM